MTIKYFFSDFKNVINLLKALVFFVFATTVNYYAVRYATKNAGTSVHDFFLITLPYINTHLIDYYFASFLEYLVLGFCLYEIKYILFFLYTGSLLILVRSFFINLTYLGLPEGVNPTMSFFTQGGDLFFSGHTALPFLAALIFWDNRKVRLFFLLITLVMGFEVLLGRHHYSIDVFAAPFITYGVFKIGQVFFKKEYSIIVK